MCKYNEAVNRFTNSKAQCYHPEPPFLKMPIFRTETYPHSEKWNLQHRTKRGKPQNNNCHESRPRQKKKPPRPVHPSPNFGRHLQIYFLFFPCNAPIAWLTRV